MNTFYKIAKQNLKEIAKEAKQNYTNDLPAIRMIINDEENETEIDDWSPTETRDYITEIDYYL